MKIPRLMLAAALLFAAAGCAETGNVKATGPDSFLLTENYTRGLFESARDRAISRAGQYCYGIDRRVLVQEVTQGVGNEHGAGSAEVAFRCLYRGDPELQRAKPR